MSEHPTFIQPAAPPPQSPARRSRGRVVGFSIASGIAGLLALAFLAAGAFLLYVDFDKDDDGYYTSSTEQLTSNSYAIASGNVDFDGAGDFVDDIGLGRVRLHAQANGDKPVFLGIARTSQVDRYLHNADHTIVTDISGGGPFGDDFDPQYRDEPGTRRPVAPAKADIWAASATGAGKQTVEWKVRDGDWSIVVMNADASRGVDTDMSAGAKLPFAGPAGWTSLGIGILATITAAAFLVLAFRAPRNNPPAAAAPVTPGTAQPAV